MYCFYFIAFLYKLFSRPLPIIRIMHTSPVLISAATMSNMTVLDTADPYDLDLTSSEAIYPISFQVMAFLNTHFNQTNFP